MPPTRIHRTARDGAHSVKPMAHPGAPLRGGCASPPGVEAATTARKRRRRKRETCEPVFFSREREHDRRNNRCYGPLRIHSPYTTPFGSSPYTRPQFRTEFGSDRKRNTICWRSAGWHGRVGRLKSCCVHLIQDPYVAPSLPKNVLFRAATRPVTALAGCDHQLSRMSHLRLSSGQHLSSSQHRPCASCSCRGLVHLSGQRLGPSERVSGQRFCTMFSHGLSVSPL